MYKHFLVISNYSARVLQSQYSIVQPPFYFNTYNTLSFLHERKC